MNNGRGWVIAGALGVVLAASGAVVLGGKQQWWLEPLLMGMSSDAVFFGAAALTVYPAADAFGFAVYLVTATDNDPVNPRSTSQLLTITINPINDVPVAYDRELVVAEAVEQRVHDLRVTDQLDRDAAPRFGHVVVADAVVIALDGNDQQAIDLTDIR